MKIVVFCHSLTSDWGHAAAHALRGLVAELQAGGHAVDVYEPEDGWSRRSLLAAEGQAAVVAFATRFPTLRSRRYRPGEPHLDRALAGAEAVLVDEWTDPALVAAVGAHRASHGAYRLLFHDGHHRGLSDRPDWDALELGGYDAALVAGHALSKLYARRTDVRRVHPWRGAADLRVVERRDRGAGFTATETSDLVWIGDHHEHDEDVLDELLLRPVRSLGMRATVYGVRFPARTRAALERAGADFRGYLPEHALPAALSRARLALHLPRAARADTRAGVPASPPFAALACGVPLISAAPGADDPIFEPDRDLLEARDGREVAAAISSLLADAARARALAQHGRATVLARHTCAHRVAELLALLRALDVREAA
jgi:spore maturation protein CgeB